MPVLIPNFDCFGFVIDFNTLTAQYDRECCAYLTNRYSSDGAGKNFVDTDLILPFKEVISIIDPQSGNSFPSTSYPSAHLRENGQGDVYRFQNEEETAKALASLREKLKAKTLVHPLLGNAEQVNLKRQELLQKAEEAQLPNKQYYSSVCIFFRIPPTEKEIHCMKERAAKFLTAHYPRSRSGYRVPAETKILGFRIVEFILTQKSIEV